MNPTLLSEADSGKYTLDCVSSGVNSSMTVYLDVISESQFYSSLSDSNMSALNT